MIYESGKKYVDSNRTIYECVAAQCHNLGGFSVVVELNKNVTKPVYLVNEAGVIMHCPTRYVAKAVKIVREYREPKFTEDWFFYWKHQDIGPILNGPYKSKEVAMEYMKGCPESFGLQKISAQIPE